ncbi:MAG: NUDIX domain-containing protein [Bdellovibrionota bacterium]
MENPFKILSSRKIYENPWIELKEHRILGPSGKPGIYGVLHFKNRAVGIVPYEDGHVWLVGQHRFPLESYSWEIPEGGSPAHEELLETAARELREETGFSAARFEKLFEMHLSNSVTDEFGVVYVATGLTAGESDPEDTEELQLRRVPLEEAVEMVDRGEITDSLTVAALYKLALMKQRGRQISS